MKNRLNYTKLLRKIFRCCNAENRRYNNPQFNQLYEAALSEKNDSVRYALYRKADQLMIKDAPVVPLWYDMVVRLVQPYVKGFAPNSLNLLELRRVKLEE